MREFTYKAPVEYLDTSGENLKDITSVYNGPDKFKIYVSRETQKWAGTEFEYDEEDRSDDKNFQVLLDFDNTNHQALMALLTNHEEHDECNEAEIVDEKYNMIYWGPTCHNVMHTYEFDEITINEQGEVTYSWKQPHVSWDTFDGAVEGYKQVLMQERDITYNEEARAKFEKCIEIMDHIKYNMRNVKPWKISFPHPRYGDTLLPHHEKLSDSH